MWTLLSVAFNDWLKHRCLRLGAALAYYAVFSLGPLLLIVTAVAGIFFGEEAVRGSVTSQFQGLIGPSGSQAIDAMMQGAASVSTGRAVAGIGIVLLLIAALGVVVQMKDALNTIWEVEDPPNAGWWWWLRTYLVSFAGILALGLLLTISLVVSAGLTALGGWLGVSAGENARLAGDQFPRLPRRAVDAVRNALQIFPRHARILAGCLARRTGNRGPIRGG